MTRSFSLPALVLIALCATMFPQPSAYSQTMPHSSQIVTSRYEKFEVSFSLPGQSGNPFDPAVNDVDVTVHGPGNSLATIPAFWDGEQWRVRYAPTRVGAYSLFITWNGRTVHPADLTADHFRCVASQNPGFVRRDPDIIQRFEFDNGHTYYPLGMDVAWTGGTGPDYPGYFGKMGANGMNFARVWMTYWDGKNLEWSPDKTKNPPRGEYLMDAARKWDAIMDDAEKNGIYVQMTLQHHGPYTAKTDPNWNDNPFNAANGGFLKNPDDFFTDPEAKRLTKAKYRYIVARWGYSTHLLSFELFNEVQNISEADSHFSDVVDWHKEMAAYLRSIDVNHHLITTSNSAPGDKLDAIGLDYNQIHVYTSDIVSRFASFDVSLEKSPVFFGEWGPSTGGEGQTVQFLHDGLWASIASPTAGAAQWWYWDGIEKNDWWSVYGAATTFVKDSWIAEHNDLTASPVTVTASGARAPLSFGLPGGWEQTTRDAVMLAPDKIPNLAGISQFIQGNGNRRLMPNPIVFSLTCAEPGKFMVEFGQVSGNGAHPTLTVDGGTPVGVDCPPGGTGQSAPPSLSVDLSAGPHQVALYNTGPDWVVANHIIVTNFTAPVAVIAKGDARVRYFWAYKRVQDGESVSAVVAFPGLTPGTYHARLWDTWTGKQLPDPSATAHDGVVQVTLPPISKDIAGVIVSK